MPEFGKFISSPGELGKKVEGWRAAVGRNEQKTFSYKADRLDSGERSVADFHGVSFIKDVIPKLIEKKKNGEKVKILDIGAGAALFTDQIREAFPDDVIVFSTGLSKKTARKIRENIKPEGEQELHRNDLKWRSVLELSDFEEFDLIIETFGELSYTILNEDLELGNFHDNVLSYLTAVIKKLKPGGLASIAPGGLIVGYLGPDAKSILSDLEKTHHVKITEFANNSNSLSIEKEVK